MLISLKRKSKQSDLFIFQLTNRSFGHVFLIYVVIFIVFAVFHYEVDLALNHRISIAFYVVKRADKAAFCS